jgi:hypothetical protein
LHLDSNGADIGVRRDLDRVRRGRSRIALAPRPERDSPCSESRNVVGQRVPFTETSPRRGMVRAELADRGAVGIAMGVTSAGASAASWAVRGIRQACFLVCSASSSLTNSMGQMDPGLQLSD